MVGGGVRSSANSSPVRKRVSWSTSMLCRGSRTRRTGLRAMWPSSTASASELDSMCTVFLMVFGLNPLASMLLTRVAMSARLIDVNGFESNAVR